MYKDIFPTISDFPRPGFNFPDITQLLETSPELFEKILNRLKVDALEVDFDKIVCVESFGYLFGAPLAFFLKKPIVLARKKGKLPRAKKSVSYSICYAEDRRLEMHVDAISSGDRVLIIDDFYASGGTIHAVERLVKNLGGVVSGVLTVVNIPSLNKYNNKLLNPEVMFHTVFEIKYNEGRLAWEVYKHRL